VIARCASDAIGVSFVSMEQHTAATAGTQRYAERFSATAAGGHFRTQQGLVLSSIGIGTYLGGADEETDKRYAAAVSLAVELGANVIDTAANYRFQRSERSIGVALRELAKRGYSRDELCLCTKGGYLPFDGTPPRDVRSYIEQTFVLTGIADWSDFVGGSHCMTPAYLESQLNQSLRNLGVDSIDVYYVHNPESQLGEIRADEFYSRLRQAFQFLESARRKKTISYYGVATWNGFRTEPNSDYYHSLPRMVEIAREVGDGDAHGFRFIQLPLNLAMPEAFTLPNHELHGKQMTTVETAQLLGVSVMCSASILQGKVARGLPDTIREPLGSLSTDAQTAIQFVRSTPGVTTALVGMSEVAHVEENLQLVKVRPAAYSDFERLFESE
jgi:aryl-alcohol dehydrogenase-like predicted oxidoreductase